MQVGFAIHLSRLTRGGVWAHWWIFHTFSSQGCRLSILGHFLTSLFSRIPSTSKYPTHALQGTCISRRCPRQSRNASFCAAIRNIRHMDAICTRWSMKAGGNWSPRIQERGAKGTKAGSADFELFTTVYLCQFCWDIRDFRDGNCL